MEVSRQLQAPPTYSRRQCLRHSLNRTLCAPHRRFACSGGKFLVSAGDRTVIPRSSQNWVIRPAINRGGRGPCVTRRDGLQSCQLCGLLRTWTALATDEPYSVTQTYKEIRKISLGLVSAVLYLPNRPGMLHTARCIFWFGSCSFASFLLSPAISVCADDSLQVSLSFPLNMSAVPY
jgi:hypothetical protein